MRKTMLATLFIGASVLSISAFAQVNLGGTAQVGAGVHAGDAVQDTMHSVDRTGTRAHQTLHRAGDHARQTTHKANESTRSAVRHDRSADARVNASHSARVHADDHRADANANLDTRAHVNSRAASDRAEDAGRATGTALRHTTHSAARATGRAAGSADGAMNQGTSGRSVDAHATLDAKAAARGH